MWRFSSFGRRMNRQHLRIHYTECLSGIYFHYIIGVNNYDTLVLWDLPWYSWCKGLYISESVSTMVSLMLYIQCIPTTPPCFWDATRWLTLCCDPQTVEGKMGLAKRRTAVYLCKWRMKDLSLIISGNAGYKAGEQPGYNGSPSLGTCLHTYYIHQVLQFPCIHTRAHTYTQTD